MCVLRNLRYGHFFGTQCIMSLKTNLMIKCQPLNIIRSGAFCLDSFSVSDVKVLIDGLCTC